MTLTDLLPLVDQCSLAELRELGEYIQKREQQIQLRAGSVDFDALRNRLAEICAGMSAEESAEVERALNRDLDDFRLN